MNDLPLIDISQYYDLALRRMQSAPVKASAHQWMQLGKFDGKVRLDWLAPRSYQLIETDPPFQFTRWNGTIIRPPSFLTDGGSIPRIFWSVPGFDPWTFIPGFVMHDWTFTLHRMNPKDPGTLEDAALLLAECMYTLVQTKVVDLITPDAAIEAIYLAVQSDIAKQYWDGTWVHN